MFTLHLPVSWLGSVLLLLLLLLGLFNPLLTPHPTSTKAMGIALFGPRCFAQLEVKCLQNQDIIISK